MTTVEDEPIAPPVTGVEPQPGQHRRRQPRLVWPAVGITVIAMGAGAWLWASDRSTEASPASSGPVATAVVERGTVSATGSWAGTVDFGAPFTVVSSDQGTVTRLVGHGQAVERGSELYRVDERPVIFLYGTVPMYRDLGAGTSGADVAQLEANLAQLGYIGFTADDTFTESTADAVRSWQADTGAEQTGTVGRGNVVYVADAGRVDTRRTDVGELVAPGRPILDLTGTDKVVSLEVDIDDRDRFNVGAGSEPETEAVTAVQITLAGDVGDDLVGAPVDFIVAIEERTDVLLVPVNALLALSEGGFGLEVVREDGTTKIVAVDTGLFADGKVQVEGDGIAEGTVVGVAGR